MAREHLKAFKDVPGAEVAGIYSRTATRAEKLGADFGIPLVTASIAELYEKTRAALVVISVPELSVREVSLEAFKHPWTCLIEKPAGYDLADAEAIADAAARLRRTAFVALNRRHHSSTRVVLEDLAQHPGPRLIQVLDQEDQIAARNANQPELVVRNWMYANSIHLIDYLTFLGRGRITAVETIAPWTPDDPHYVASKIAYESGDIGIYTAVWNGPGPWAISVSTREKRWELRPLEQAAFQVYGSRKLEPVAPHEWDVKFKPGLRAQAEEAVKAATGERHSLPTLKDAIASMRLVHAIYGDGSE
jgi:predicted dehydrogenase